METRRERKKNQTRDSLLAAAMGLFGERGIRGTRVEDITERTDLGKGAFYNHFESKDALVAELVARGVERFEKGYLSGIDGSASQGERIVAIAHQQERFFVENPEYDLLLHQARGLALLDGTSAVELRLVFRRYLAGIARVLVTPDSSSWNEEELLDASAAVAGGIAGYRSLRLAADLTRPSNGVVEAFVLGLPALLERRRAGSAPPQPEPPPG